MLLISREIQMMTPSAVYMFVYPDQRISHSQQLYQYFHQSELVDLNKTISYSLVSPISQIHQTDKMCSCERVCVLHVFTWILDTFQPL